MAKLVIFVLALATSCMGMGYPGGFGYTGSVSNHQQVSRSSIGTSYGGVSKQSGVGITSSSFGGLGPAGGIGVSKQISSHSHSHSIGSAFKDRIAGAYSGGIGVSKQISHSVGSSRHGLGFGGVGSSSVNQLSSVRHHHHQGLGSHLFGGVSSYNSVNTVKQLNHGYPYSQYFQLGHLGPLNAVAGISSIHHRFGIPAITTIPAGYFGGLLTFPQTIPASITTSSLHIPTAAIDPYKGTYLSWSSVTSL